MREIVLNYPSLIARAYLLIDDNLQRKDLQRFWFENTISFLAVAAASNLVKHYNLLKSKDELDEKDKSIIEELKNNPSLTSIGFEHMSLGKWVGCLRESIKAFKKVGFRSAFMDKLEEFYKKQEKNINT